MESTVKLGAYIDVGPQNWEIIQQQRGYADISLRGRKFPTEGNEGTVYARIVEENTGMPIKPWQKCEDVSAHVWETVLSGVPAGGLYRVETCLNQDHCARMEWSIRGDMIHHIGVGDVFVIAGQSNSAGYGRDTVSDPAEIGVHLLRGNGRWDLATHPMNDTTGIVHEENRENTNPGHSPYLRFAKTLKNKLGYPIGLVQASRGGSPLAAWNLEQDGVLFNNMLDITKHIGHHIKGILWYQGCSDTTETESKTYLERFASVVKDFRKAYGNDVPILTVQINHATDEHENIKNWGRIKEAQRQAGKLLEHVYVVPSSDLPLSDRIHISASGNIVLGDRIAASALRNLYSMTYGFEAPDLSAIEVINAKTLQLKFDNIHDRLFLYEAPIEAVSISVKDRNGEVPLIGYEVMGNTFLLKLGRAVDGDCCVSGGCETITKPIIPKDSITHMPMLSFFEVGASNI